MKLVLLLAATTMIAACTQKSEAPQRLDTSVPTTGLAFSKEDLIKKGRTIYISRCTACHAMDPKSAGSIGPDVAGSSLELLRAKILTGQYPSGYTPKRNTKIMTIMPDLAPDIEAVHSFLSSATR